MGIEQRVRIAKDARHLRIHGFNNRERRFPRKPIPEDAVARGYLEFQEMKPELYSLAAIFADAALDRAIAKKDHAKVYSFHGQDEMYPFNATIAIPLNRAVDEVIKDSLNGALGQAYESNYRRFSSLMQLLGYVLSERYNASPNDFIKRGIRTATNFMSQVLIILPVVADTVYLSELTEIASHSLELFTRFANDHVEFGIPSIHGLEKDDGSGKGTQVLDPSCFTIQSHDGLRQISLSDRGEGMVNVIRENKLIMTRVGDFPYGPTVGCPAMVNFGTGSGIKKMWEWHIEVAKQVWP